MAAGFVQDTDKSPPRLGAFEAFIRLDEPGLPPMSRLMPAAHIPLGRATALGSQYKFKGLFSFVGWGGDREHQALRDDLRLADRQPRLFDGGRGRRGGAADPVLFDRASEGHGAVRYQHASRLPAGAVISTGDQPSGTSDHGPQRAQRSEPN